MTDKPEPTIDDVLNSFKDSCTAFEWKYAEVLKRCEALESGIQALAGEKDDATKTIDKLTSEVNQVEGYLSALKNRSLNQLQNLYLKFDTDFKSFHGDAYDRVQLIFDGKPISWKNIHLSPRGDIIHGLGDMIQLYSNLIFCYGAFNAALMAECTVLKIDLNSQKNLLEQEYVKVATLKEESLKVARLQDEKEVLSKVHGQLIIDFDRVNVSNNELHDKIGEMEQEYRLLTMGMDDVDLELKYNSDILGLLSKKKYKLVWLLGLSKTASLEDSFEYIYTAVIKLKKEKSCLEDKLSSLIVKEENDVNSKQLSFNFNGISDGQNDFFEEFVSDNVLDNGGDKIQRIYEGDKPNRWSAFKSVIISYKKYIITGVAVAAAGLVMLGLENYNSNNNVLFKHTRSPIVISTVTNNISDGYSQKDISEQYDIKSEEMVDAELISDNNNVAAGSVGVYDSADESYYPIIKVASREDAGTSGFYDTNSSISNSIGGVKKKSAADNKVNRKRSESCGSKYTIASFKKSADWSEWSCHDPDKVRISLCFTASKYISQNIADKHNLYFGCLAEEQLCCPKNALKSNKPIYLKTHDKSKEF